MELAYRSTAAIPFHLYQPGDHLSPALGQAAAAQAALQLWKGGGVFAPATGVVVEVGNGDYELVPSLEETGTYGALILHIPASAAYDAVDDLHWIGNEPIALGSTRPIPFFMVSAANHLSGLPGVLPTVTIAKNSPSFGTPSGAVTEIAFGWWYLTPVATDTGTPGAFVLHATAAGADAVDDLYQIVNRDAPWGTWDLLRRLKRGAGLADASEEDDALDLCPILTAAQAEVIREIAIRCTNALYSLQGPTALVPSADRKTFSFGMDAGGNPIVAMGWVQISPRLTAFSGDSAYYWREGVDFLDEGTRIRIPSNRSYAGTLYGRWVPTPPPITLEVDPVLLPVEARELVLNRAVKNFSGEGNVRPDLVQAMRDEWAEKFPTWMLTFKRRFRGGGALLDPALWYLYAPDLGRS